MKGLNLDLKAYGNCIFGLADPVKFYGEMKTTQEAVGVAAQKRANSGAK